MLALTATATASVAQDICRNFATEPDAYVNTGFHRPNLVMWAVACSAGERDELLLRRLRERPPGATIVYVTLQKTAEEVAEVLRANGMSALAYHRRLASRKRGLENGKRASDPTSLPFGVAFA